MDVSCVGEIVVRRITALAAGWPSNLTAIIVAFDPELATLLGWGVALNTGGISCRTAVSTHVLQP